VQLRYFNGRFQIEECAFDPGIQLNDASEQFPLPTPDVDNGRYAREVVGHQNGICQQRRKIRHPVVERIRGFGISLEVIKQTCSENIVERWRTGSDTLKVA
jgi:hypothetical protein